MNIFTIGHSTRSIYELIGLLKDHNISHLVDIRGMPGSNKFPQFNKENLIRVLPSEGISYSHILKLGGRRKKPTQNNPKNSVWKNMSFRNYANYMDTSTFKEGINDLEYIGKKEISCYMCSESVWWRCHRSMVSDYLKLNGWDVIHILGKGNEQIHPDREFSINCIKGKKIPELF